MQRNSFTTKPQIYFVYHEWFTEEVFRIDCLLFTTIKSKLRKVKNVKCANCYIIQVKINKPTFFQNRLKSGQPRYRQKKISATVIPRAPRVSMWLNTCLLHNNKNSCVCTNKVIVTKILHRYAEKFPAGWHVRPEEGIGCDGFWVTQEDFFSGVCFWLLGMFLKGYHLKVWLW